MSSTAKSINIRPMEKEDAERVSKFVQDVFKDFVKPDFESKGVEIWMEQNTSETMLEQLKLKNVTLLAEINGELIGVIGLYRGSHLGRLFVAPEYHGQGVGKLLFRQALEKCRANNPELKAITVNSSLYAVSFYKHLGFKQTEEEQRRNGMRFIPMCKELD